MSSAFCCALLLGGISLESMAQNRQRATDTDVLPRVGTIKNYPATGLMTGCGNLYAYPLQRTDPSPEAYVFLSNGDGGNAWMNLDGRDVRLQQSKQSADQYRPQEYFYRLGTLRVSVLLEAFKPEGSADGDTGPMFKMKITLRRGRAKRIIHAVGDSDC
jgi:hypothetical protein